MKIFISFTLFLLTNLTLVGQNDHWVKPYTRKDGTYVEGHYRTNRNDTPWDNYSTIGNVNPYTGKEGWINPQIPDYGYKNVTTDWYTYSDYISNWYSFGKNKISIYSDFEMAPQIKVFINNKYAGKTEYNFVTTPTCGQYGTMTANCDNRIYEIKAIDPTGYYWSFNLNTSNECNSYVLRYSEEQKYRIGELYAKSQHKSEPYLFWVPFLTGAVYWPLAIPSFIGCNIKYKKLPTFGDPDFQYGYHQKAKFKNFGKTFIGAGLGVALNFLLRAAK